MNFGLTGNPLGHSFSKIIHLELFRLKGKNFNYELYPSDNLDELFENQLSKLGGFNITIPYKTDIIKFLHETDDKVKLYNACNTVVNHNGVYRGYNTDVYGFLNTLKKCKINLQNKKVLVLGSGGVSRMMSFECALNGAKVYITSRNKLKCQEIKEEVENKTGIEVMTVDFDYDFSDFDVVLNGTPCGMYPKVLSLAIPFEKIKNVPFVFDTIYNPRETLLTKLAKYCGNSAENGLYMLVEQAAVAQKYFCNLDYTEDEVQMVTDKVVVEPLILNKNIVLIGPPGSGKTTIGKELAKILNLEFVDIDAEIVSRYGNINEIFQTKGEKYFRQIETEVLREISKANNLLISTGGGVVENTSIMNDLHADDNNIILFINPSFEVLLNRTKYSNERPLLLGNTAEKLKNLLDRRMPLYEEFCNVKVNILCEQDKKSTVLQCIDSLCFK